MTNTLNQVEKNTQASFGYVKKDLMNLNDTVSDLQTKIQHLSMNHAALLAKISEMESKGVKKKRVSRKKRGRK